MNQNTTITTTKEFRITKSDLAKKYGKTWRSFRNQVFVLIPALKGNRRRILYPIEIQKIYDAFGKPEIDDLKE